MNVSVNTLTVVWILCCLVCDFCLQGTQAECHKYHWWSPVGKTAPPSTLSRGSNPTVKSHTHLLYCQELPCHRLPHSHRNPQGLPFQSLHLEAKISFVDKALYGVTVTVLQWFNALTAFVLYCDLLSQVPICSFSLSFQCCSLPHFPKACGFFFIVYFCTVQ